MELVVDHATSGGLSPLTALRGRGELGEPHDPAGSLLRWLDRGYLAVEGIVTKSGKSAPDQQGDRPYDPVLRAKYLDHCSARVAELLLRLTPDEMYLLAEDVTRELELESARTLSYSAIVRLATDHISTKLSLPDFQSWLGAYLENPEKYEQEMLGLWEAELGTSNQRAH